MAKAFHIFLLVLFVMFPLVFILTTVLVWSGVMSVAHYKVLVEAFVIDCHWYIGGFFVLFGLLLIFEAKLN